MTDDDDDDGDNSDDGCSIGVTTNDESESSVINIIVTVTKISKPFLMRIMDAQ